MGDSCGGAEALVNTGDAAGLVMQSSMQGRGCVLDTEKRIKDAYEAVLINYGSRSTGDDLLGFEFDLRCELGDLPTDGEIKLVRGAPDDFMFLIHGTVACDIDRADLRARITHSWLRKLRYSKFEMHEFIESIGSLNFYFVTYSFDGIVGVHGRLSLGFKDVSGKRERIALGL